MPEVVELLFAELEEQRQISENVNRRIKDLMTLIKQADKEAWDWISVKKGAELLDVSVNMIYRKIDNGILDVKHIGAKTFIRKSQLQGIDDKC